MNFEWISPRFSAQSQAEKILKKVRGGNDTAESDTAESDTAESDTAESDSACVIHTVESKCKLHSQNRKLWKSLVALKGTVHHGWIDLKYERGMITKRNVFTPRCHSPPSHRGPDGFETWKKRGQQVNTLPLKQIVTILYSVQRQLHSRKTQSN